MKKIKELKILIAESAPTRSFPIKKNKTPNIYSGSFKKLAEMSKKK